MLILIVEDDARVARFLSRGLQEEGHTVDVCERGDVAMDQGLAQPYEVILLDWGLPGLDGVSLLRHWRDGGLTAPVIMLTARTGVPATVLALDSGADDYLPKPFSFEELLARIRSVTRRLRREGPAGVVRVGASTLDLRERTVTRGGETDGLSGREFALLDLLLKHRGDVLSRSRILDRVWGVSADPTTNVVDVYIGYLRAKLDAPGAASVIETVRGRGYRLRPEGELDAGPAE